MKCNERERKKVKVKESERNCKKEKESGSERACVLVCKSIMCKSVVYYCECRCFFVFLMLGYSDLMELS